MQPLAEYAPTEGSKGVRGLACIVFPTGLSDGQRHGALAGMMVGTIPRPLKQCPQAFDGVRMQPAVPASRAFLVSDDRRRQEGFSGVVAPVFGRDEGRTVWGNSPLEKLGKGFAGQGFDYLGQDLAASLTRPDAGGLLRAPARLVGLMGRCPLRAAGLAASGGFVCFAQTTQQTVLGGPSGPNPLLHGPGGLLGDLESPAPLVAAQALLGIEDQADGEEPLLQGNPRLFKDRPGKTLKLDLQA